MFQITEQGSKEAPISNLHTFFSFDTLYLHVFDLGYIQFSVILNFDNENLWYMIGSILGGYLKKREILKLGVQVSEKKTNYWLVNLLWFLISKIANLKFNCFRYEKNSDVTNFGVITIMFSITKKIIKENSNYDFKYFCF